MGTRRSIPNRSLTTTLAVAALWLAACGPTDSPICSPTDPSCAPPQDTTNGGAGVMSVVSVLPTTGATAVDYAANIVLRFSAPVDTLAAGDIRVGTLDGTLTYAGSLVTFDPAESLAPGTTFQVTATNVLGTSGEQMTAPFSSSFTTREVAVAASASASVSEASTGGTITLDTSGSAGTTTWRQIAGPSVGPLTGVSPSFPAPDEMGTLGFELTATDGTDVESDTVWVTVFEDLERALYVSPNGLAGNPGTREAPLASIQEAIDAADALGDGTDVYVAAGTYAETLTLAANVGLYGGFDADSWDFDPDVSMTVVEGGSTAVVARGASSIRMSWMHIRAADAVDDGGSSIGLLFEDATDALLRGNVIEAGAGMDGRPGTDRGTRGGRGGDGSDGGGHGSCSDATGGRGGGIGGQDGWNGGRGGAGGKSAGSGGSKGNGDDGGAGGSGSTGREAGSPGTPGDPGPIGSSGAGGAAFGSVDDDGYYPAVGGTGGTGRAGFGGGGGGGGTNIVFAAIACGGGGGGGGEGGVGGYGATGGLGGGASLGVLLLGASDVVVVESDIRTSEGGAGGIGGRGGAGQEGGDGGDGGSGDGDDRYAGGKGGKGGRGGTGGPGGGGGGGPSIGIVAQASVTLDASEGNVYTLGPAGPGGISGGTGINGQAGTETEVHVVN
ncbi:MAG: Ig-like domain-containing protein [Gemmatimonadota bacterium]